MRCGALCGSDLRSRRWCDQVCLTRKPHPPVTAAPPPQILARTVTTSLLQQQLSVAAGDGGDDTRRISAGEQLATPAAASRSGAQLAAAAGGTRHPSSSCSSGTAALSAATNTANPSSRRPARSLGDDRPRVVQVIRSTSVDIPVATPKQQWRQLKDIDLSVPGGAVAKPTLAGSSEQLVRRARPPAGPPTAVADMRLLFPSHLPAAV